MPKPKKIKYRELEARLIINNKNNICKAPEIKYTKTQNKLMKKLIILRERAYCWYDNYIDRYIHINSAMYKKQMLQPMIIENLQQL